ncbi:hypothetical protein M2352_002955 [Azospirillum fermentarium]|uniref:hypothetical protein n=1 Tax=Azospirillum fermentarium TaxID=1233114 RepID=UPI0022276341|nr:hypothetical protein [Azospirillum fermentarium]MCW2247364.1 hypothetical protein [Azospirillum fermentarium]
MRTRRNGPRWLAAVRLGGVALVGLLAGCAASGPSTMPVERGLSWFSYLNGDDLRRSCGQDRADRFRLVFNADYNQHIRTYDITADPDKGGAVVVARVIQAADLRKVNPTDSAGLDLMGPWRGERAETRLTPRQFAQFVLRLSDSGAFEPLPGTVRLPSNAIYWLVNGCRSGAWFFNVYPYPMDRFADIRFDAPVKGMDGTGVPFPPLPAPDDAPRMLPPAGARGDSGGVFFELEVDRGGLVGPTHLFGPWNLLG